MVNREITITRTDSGFALCVDGGNIECSTTAEVMSRVGHEIGMPFNKAQRQLFERMESAEKVCKALEEELRETTEHRNAVCGENERLRAAIVGWFVRAYGGGENGKVH